LSETFHAEFGDLFTSAHSSIAVFIKNVLATQMDSHIRMNSASNNESKIIKTQQKTNIKFINKKIEVYKDNQIDIYNFCIKFSFIIVLNLIVY
jgi:hypothetical protein